MCVTNYCWSLLDFLYTVFTIMPPRFNAIKTSGQVNSDQILGTVSSHSFVIEHLFFNSTTPTYFNCRELKIYSTSIIHNAHTVYKFYTSKMRRMFFLKYYTICTCTVQFIDCFSTVKKMRRMREGAQVREYCPPPYYVVIYFLFFLL